MEKPLKPTRSPVDEIVDLRSRGARRSPGRLPYLATLATVHRLAELPNPMDTLDGYLMWRGLRPTQLTRAQTQAAALSWAEIHTIVAAMGPAKSATLRDAALKRRALAAGLPAQSISAHSTRVGAAQELLQHHYSTGSIMLAGGWKTERMVVRYGRKLAASRNAMARLQRKRQT